MVAKSCQRGWRNDVPHVRRNSFLRTTSATSFGRSEYHVGESLNSVASSDGKFMLGAVKRWPLTFPLLAAFIAVLAGGATLWGQSTAVRTAAALSWVALDSIIEPADDWVAPDLDEPATRGQGPEQEEEKRENSGEREDTSGSGGPRLALPGQAWSPRALELLGGSLKAPPSLERSAVPRCRLDQRQHPARAPPARA